MDCSGETSRANHVSVPSNIGVSGPVSLSPVQEKPGLTTGDEG